MEHRWGDRMAVNVPVRVRWPGNGAIVARIANLSISGALIRSWRLPPLHSKIEVLLGNEAVDAFVVRLMADTCGLEWCELAPAVLNALLATPAAIAGPNATAAAPMQHENAIRRSA
jgi:hypothetical protein